MIFFRKLWVLTRADKVTFLSFFVLVFWIILATLPLLSTFFENVPISLRSRLQYPSSVFWLGTNSNGQSLALLIINGASTSFVVSVATVFTSLFLGIPLGAIAGYFGGKTDSIICHFIDILLAFPPMVLPIAIMAFFGGAFFNVVLSLSITGLVGYARLVRGQFLSFKNRDFVMSARSLGASHFRIMLRHIFPNIVSPLVVQATFALAGVILAEAGLSFLGLGMSRDHVSWGCLLNESKDYITIYPFLAFFPACALFSLVLSLNFIGESLRLALDPKSITLAS